MAGVLTVVLIIVADQLVKYFVAANLALGEARSFIPGILGITRTHNYGISFGLFDNISQLLPAILAVALTVAIAYLLKTGKIRPRIQRWAAIFVIGGALGNAIDRVFRGYVIDMFEFKFVNFAIFNVADVCLVLGGIVFCVHYILFDFKNSKNKEAQNGDS